jgi:hypothetical protein
MAMGVSRIAAALLLMISVSHRGDEVDDAESTASGPNEPTSRAGDL